MIRYSEHTLPPPLSRFVEYVWFLHADAPAAAVPERVVPDGCPELVFQLADPCLAGRPGSSLMTQPRALLVGPLTSAILVAPAGRVATMGIRFRPSGLAAFLPISLGELPDRQVAPEDLFGPAARELAERLLAASREPQRVALAVRFLRTRLRQPDAPVRPVERAVSCMVARRGPVAVERLAGGLGITRRHLERAFVRETGMGPSRLGRVIRFQSVFRELAESRKGWAEVAVACGYYDQSHLYRDFRDFAAAPPGELFAADPAGAFGGAFVSAERLDRFFAN